MNKGIIARWTRVPALAALAAVACLGDSRLRADPGDPPVGYRVNPKGMRKQAWGLVEKRLAEAEKKANDTSLKSFDEFRDFFKGPKENARGFAEELLSLRGKWEFVSRTNEEYRRYLRERYEAHVLKPDALREVLERVTREYLRELEGIENELLVAVQTDLDEADLPRGAIPAINGRDTLAKQFRETARELEGLMAKNLRETVGREVTSFAVGEVAARLAIRVATAAAVRLGMSATVLGTGAASTVATFGFGLVAGFVVDYLLDEILHALGYDPAEEIAEQVRDGLTKLNLSLMRADEDRTRVAVALMRQSKEDPDQEARLACQQAMRELMRSGTMGLQITLAAAGEDRGLVWRGALERLILGTSDIADLLARTEKEWAPLRRYTDAEALKEVSGLLAGRTNPDVESVLDRLKAAEPGQRVRAAKAAVLLYGRSGPDVPEVQPGGVAATPSRPAGGVAVIPSRPEGRK